MYETKYQKPANVAEAVAAMRASEDGVFLGGGQTLIPTMKQRLAAPSDVINLADLDELKGISVDAKSVTIGAATKHVDVATSSQVQEAIPALAKLAGGIGDPQVRNQGTLGGSVANNDPAADYPSAVLALGATIRTNCRIIAADDFFDGLFTTVLEEDEIIISITFPRPQKAAYAKFDNPASRYAIAGVFVAQLPDGSVRVAVTGAGGDGVYRESAMEAALVKSFTSHAIEGIEIEADNMMADMHGSADYRANIVKVMATRAVAAA